MKKIVLVFSILFIFFYANNIIAQDKKEIHCQGIVVDGDTMILVNLSTVEVYAYTGLSDYEVIKYSKLVRNVRKVYPYAQIAKEKLQYYNEILAKTKDEKKRKEIMKKAEKDIEAEFSDDIKDMTLSQGKILIKLIDRETGSTSYALVKELRGSFRAFFYQAFAKIFGASLKSEYDPINNEEDAQIEKIVRSIEQEQI